MKVPKATVKGYDSIKKAANHTNGLFSESGESKRKILVYATKGHNKMLRQAKPETPRQRKVIGLPYKANPFAYNTPLRGKNMWAIITSEARTAHVFLSQQAPLASTAVCYMPFS